MGLSRVEISVCGNMLLNLGHNRPVLSSKDAIRGAVVHEDADGMDTNKQFGTSLSESAVQSGCLLHNPHFLNRKKRGWMRCRKRKGTSVACEWAVLGTRSRFGDGL